MSFYGKGKSANDFKSAILNKSNSLFGSRGSWELVVELENIHMEDLKPRGFSMGSRDKEIDFETFASFKGLDIFKSNMGYFI